MPEGDTLFRAARAMHRALAGAPVVRFESGYAHVANVDRETPIAGRIVESVSAAGKHVLVRFSGDLVLRTHMRMNGSWHLYRPGERWRRPRSAMRVLIETPAFVAVGFDVPVAELVGARALARGPVGKLGPDLLAEEFDAAEAARRIRVRPDATMAEALLDQRAVAGAGNVFKSEVLFLARVHPFTRVSAVADATLEDALAIARRLLRSNVRDDSPAAIVTYTGFRRTTGRSDPGARLWVYGRAGKPCRRCGTAIEYRKIGPDERSSYWCPRCQPAPEK